MPLSVHDANKIKSKMELLGSLATAAVCEEAKLFSLFLLLEASPDADSVEPCLSDIVTLAVVGVLALLILLACILWIRLRSSRQGNINDCILRKQWLVDQ